MGVAVIGMGKAANVDAAYIEPGKTLRQAGHLMRELGVAALVVRAENGEVRGTISHDMVVRSIAAGGDPKTVTVGEVASGGVAHRRAPARSAGAGVTRRHHSPDPSGHQLNWEEIGPGTAWPGVALAADELTCASTLARSSPGLVALAGLRAPGHDHARLIMPLTPRIICRKPRRQRGQSGQSEHPVPAR